MPLLGGRFTGLLVAALVIAVWVTAAVIGIPKLSSSVAGKSTQAAESAAPGVSSAESGGSAAGASGAAGSRGGGGGSAPAPAPRPALRHGHRHHPQGRTGLAGADQPRRGRVRRSRAGAG